MSFTSVGRILAFLMIAFGAMRLLAGVVAAVDGTPATAARYLGSTTSGQAIDEALWVIGTGILIGILTDISRALRKWRPAEASGPRRKNAKTPSRGTDKTDRAHTKELK